MSSHERGESATNMIPLMIRGLSLIEISDTYGSEGLAARTEKTLRNHELWENESIQKCMNLGLELHKNDKRTNGPYNDHLSRVALRVMEDCGVYDPDIISAAYLHDSIEDHPEELVTLLGGEINSDEGPRGAAFRLIQTTISPEVADIVMAVTNPVVEKSENKTETYQRKIKAYTDHTNELVAASPKARVLKLSDFIDNAVNNHTTLDERMKLRLDDKYIRQYEVHRRGIVAEDSLIPPHMREGVILQLERGQGWAQTRLERAQRLWPQLFSAALGNTT